MLFDKENTETSLIRPILDCQMSNLKPDLSFTNISGLKLPSQCQGKAAIHPFPLS
jgi:hypothetical protein